MAHPPLSPVADDFHQVSPSLALWHAYDPASKAELFTSAVATPDGLVLIDPIQLAPAALDQACSGRNIAAIAITSANHWRAAAWFARKFSAPVFAHARAADAGAVPAFQEARSGDKLGKLLEVLDLAGGAPGEVALAATIDGVSTLIVGDALINFPPYGFALLPQKYCTNQGQLRHSLGQTVPLAPKRILFAHGLPLVDKAASKLEALLHVPA
jgi:hypothetical protein